MANIKSAKKRIKVNEKKAFANKAQRTELKTLVKNAELALENNADNKVDAVAAAIKKLDSASTRGILHKNNAARKKSQLTRKLNAIA